MSIELKEILKKEFDKDKGLQTDLAIKYCYDRSSFHKFLNSENRQLSDLTILVNVVNHFFPDKKQTLLNDYFLTVSPSTQFARQALEYSHFFSLSCFNALVDTMLNSSNRLSKDLAELYQLNKLSKSFKGNQLEKIMGEFYGSKSSDKLTKFIKDFSILSILYRLDHFTLMDEKIKELYTVLDEIEDTFFKASFHLRLLRLVSVYELYQNNINKSRNTCKILLEVTNEERVLKSTYHTLGISYLFEDYDLGMSYLRKAHAILPHLGHSTTNIESSMNIHCLLWNRAVQALSLETVSRCHELAFINFNRGKLDEAIIKLDDAEQNEMSHNDLAFHYFIKGKIKKDKELLLESVMLYKKLGNYLYMQLPREELRVMGTEEIMLRAICS